MEITWGASIAVWWSFMWRSVVYSLIGGLVVGFIGGVIAVILQQDSMLHGMIAGYLVYIPASMFALKKTLQKHVPILASL